jgi:hypothetical protein
MQYRQTTYPRERFEKITSSANETPRQSKSVRQGKTQRQSQRKKMMQNLTRLKPKKLRLKRPKRRHLQFVSGDYL